MLSVKMYFSTSAGEEAKLYYSRRKELEDRSAELQKAKQTYDNLTKSVIESFLSGKYNLAREEFRRAAMVETDDEDGMNQLFKIEMKIEEKVQKQKISALFIAARKQLRKSKFKQCLKSVDEILNIAPESKQAVLLRCKCLAYQALNKGEYVEAKKFLEDALIVSPGNAGISKLLRRLGRFVGDKKDSKKENKR